MKRAWKNTEGVERLSWYFPRSFLSDPPQDTTHYPQGISDDLIISQGHHISLLGESAGALRLDIGGPFLCVKRSRQSTFGSLGKSIDFSQSSNPFDPNPYGGHYRSPQYAVDPVDHNDYYFGPEIASSAHELDMLGTEAIARCAPTKSYAELSQAIGEFIADGTPAVPMAEMKKSAGLANGAGSDYLNSEFGWKPLVSDVKNLASAVINAESILDEYEKGSGRLIRRRYNFPTEQTVQEFDFGYHSPKPLLEYGFFKPGKSEGHLTMTRTRTVRQWFSGAFTYYFPPRGSAMRKQAEARKLLGVELTPATLWNLAPWSWAADWFANTGDVLDAFDNLHTDGLIMPWAYIMEEVTNRDVYYLRGVEYMSYSGSPTLSQTWETQIKQRQRATPWGFGFDMEEMTPRQWAILIALGLTRSGK